MHKAVQKSPFSQYFILDKTVMYNRPENQVVTAFNRKDALQCISTEKFKVIISIYKEMISLIIKKNRIEIKL